jgi:hypothetical protein
MFQNPSSHSRDSTCRTMHPDKIMHHPVDIQAFLESPRGFCVHIGSPPVGRTPASQRGVKGFQMVRVNLLRFKRLGCLRMLWIRSLIFRPFGPALMSLRPLILQPHFDPLAQRFLWPPSLASPSGFAAQLKQETPLASLAIGQQRQIAGVLDAVTQETHRIFTQLAVCASTVHVPQKTRRPIQQYHGPSLRLVWGYFLVDPRV